MDASAIIEAARPAGKLWAKKSPRDRRNVLSRVASLFAERQDALVSAIVQDTGKPPLEALGGDVLVTLDHMRFYHWKAHRILAPRRVARDWLLFRSTRFSQSYEPHGVVLIYAPANYPLQLSMVPAITALYAGNSVVLKLSEQTPALAETLRALVTEAGMPDNLLQIVCDPPEKAGEYVDARPDFICFTGSSINGANIAERAARHLIPTLLELGGKDAAIVFKDCHLERTIEGVLYGAFANSGQVCVGIKRLYVEEQLYAGFTRRLVERTAQLRVGHDANPAYDLAPIRSKQLIVRLASQISDALARGAEVLTDASDVSGRVPLILATVSPDAQILRDEVFGPVVCVATFRDETHAIQLANDTDFALGASVWTSDLAKARRIASQLHAANITVNDVIRNVANPAAPFGGNRHSGYGRYHGAEGLLAFSRTKTTMINSSRSRREINWFPLSTKTYGQLRKLIDLRHRIFARWFFGMLIPFVIAKDAMRVQQQSSYSQISFAHTTGICSENSR
jgi:acyl-CoA reductase-like NAD-dependent aldehyde dehydrogenase